MATSIDDILEAATKAGITSDPRRLISFTAGYISSLTAPATGSEGLPAPKRVKISAAESSLAKKIDGRAMAKQIRSEMKEEIRKFKEANGYAPGLAVVQVGNRPDSSTYVRMKKKAAAEVNLHTVDMSLPETVSQDELVGIVQKLNKDPKVHGILVQLPLPKHIDQATVLQGILVSKDADGFLAQNIGNLCLRSGGECVAKPCTPAGCMEMLKRSGVVIKGKTAVVLGRSDIVGMPVSQLLQQCNATVTVCHSKTPDIPAVVRRADIVVAAIGKPEFVRGSWLKPGAVVIDVGINQKVDATRKRGYRLVGDVCRDEAKHVASMISPVPGGVGPMTIAMLICNTVRLAQRAVAEAGAEGGPAAQ